MTVFIERPLTPEEKIARAEAEAAQPGIEKDEATNARRQGYQTISDPIFFKWQRGEATKEEWDIARAEVEALYPIPGE